MELERQQFAALVGRHALRSGEGRRLRCSLGFSLRGAARVIGTDPASLSRWERSLVVPRMDVAARYGDIVAGWLSVTEVLEGAK